MNTIRAQQPEIEPQVEPIAIIGMGCRFPGAQNPEAFWRLLSDGRDVITDIPKDRFDVDAFYDPKPRTPGKIATRYGGFLDQVDQFDPYFFGISPREADRLDPQQRLLLEVAWEALEDAGQVPEKLSGSQAGVFVGMWLSDYEARLFQQPHDVDFYMTTGSGRYTASGRLSYTFGFQGPSVTIDTACSSSLVAVHLACQSLWNRECTLALAGGANVILQPHITIAYCQSGMLAPDGRCKFGDARANGYVRSEGAGLVVLQPLSQALADNNPIYAIVRGSAVNNDGHSSGFLTTPGSQGQEALLRSAYHKAGVSPGSIQYVEAHGTGTSAGDPVELRALGTVLSQDRPPNQPCLIGSVKTNIGHTEGAAGVAGLIKVALSLKHRTIPASLHFQTPNPDIPWQELPLVVQQERSPWPAHTGPALAGVSSFGISGTNAHVVLQEAPEIETTSKERVSDPQKAHLLTISAHSPDALEALAGAYQSFVSDTERVVPPLSDLCYTAGVKRAHHDHRLALVVHSHAELADHLDSFRHGEICSGMSIGHRLSDKSSKLVFVFPGQGAQWIGMGRQLLEREPVFLEEMEQCDKAMQLYAPWSLLEQIEADEDQSILHRIDVIQPTLFAIQVSLAALWRSWGVEPDAVVGHSMGEVAAAYVAGALSLEDAVRVICQRSRLLRRTSGKGAMAMVELSLSQARDALRGYEDYVSIAVSNSERSTVLSGDPDALKGLIQTFESQDIFCRWVNVDVASHSPQMDPLRTDLLQVLEDLKPRSTTIPIYSTVTSQIIDGCELDATYWVRNLREPVLFSTVIQHLLSNAHDTFIEISAHPVLVPAMQQTIQESEYGAMVLPSLRRDEEEQAVMLASLGTLYTQGCPIAWNRLYGDAGRSVRLPVYPWQRERFWLDRGETHRGGTQLRYDRTTGHPFLGPHVVSSVHAGTHFWDLAISTDFLPYLADHRVYRQAVLPAAAYVELALAAANEAFGSLSQVRHIGLQQALFLPEGSVQNAQLVLVEERPGTASFKLLSRQAGETAQQVSWTVHASGTLQLGLSDETLSIPTHDALDELQARCVQTMDATAFYQAMARQGIEYGANFQIIEQLWGRDQEALGRLRLPATIASECHRYQIHPALLDACFQVLVATRQLAADGMADENTCLPIRLDRLRLYDWPENLDALWAHAVRWETPEDQTETWAGDVWLLDEVGHVVLEAKGLHLQRLERADSHVLDDWLYTIEWQLAARPEQKQLQSDQTGSWLIFADRRGVSTTLAARLEASGETCILVSPGATYQCLGNSQYVLDWADPASYQQLLKDALGDDQPPCRGVVHCWSFDAISSEDSATIPFEVIEGPGTISLLYLIQALVQVSWQAAPRLWLVTDGTQVVEVDNAARLVHPSPIWGLGSVIAVEHPEFHCTRVDLSLQDVVTDAVPTLFEELWSNNDEDQIALRGEGRYVARLKRYIPTLRQQASSDTWVHANRMVAAPDQNYQVEIATAGVLDNLALFATPRQKPRADEVEIQVYAAGLNFLDVLKALGVYPGLEAGAPVALGAECSGKVVAVGDNVKCINIGDDVIAITPSFNTASLFGAFVTIPSELVVPKPKHLSYEEAATIPLAFLTAYYALHHLGRLHQNDRVLIHSATGGVGLAAVQLAQRTGSVIFATAGSEEKRAFLKSLGIQHVMDSRSLDFAEDIMERTGGEGVDVVLNSLTGDAIAKSLSILKPYGRFLEIGKRDIYENHHLGLEPFKKNLTFSAIDLARMVEERPEFMASLLRDLMSSFEEKTLCPLPLQTFPISKVADAFRYMAQAKHMGKIVLSLHDQEVLIAPADMGSSPIRSDGTYLITGGLGGLGLSVAQWMIGEGAHHLVLMGRRGASASTQDILNDMQANGAEIVIARADVADKEQVARVLAEIDQTMPPLRGIIHAAGILDDGILLHMNQERFRSVMAPKVHGAWNLHTLTLDRELDFFVLFSSLAAFLGVPGQGNYAAANAYLDGLAQQRRAQGMQALSINWGPWAEVGLSAAQARERQHHVYKGLTHITPGQGIEVLEALLLQAPPQVAVVSFHAQQWRQLHPSTSGRPFWSHWDPVQSDKMGEGLSVLAPEDSIQSALRALPAGPQRRLLLESHLKEQCAQVLKFSPSRMDPHKALGTMGLDSLMSLELRNRLETSLGLKLPASLIWNYPTIAVLAPQLAEIMNLPLEETVDTQSPLDDGMPSAAAIEMESYSQDTINAMLAEELEAIDQLLRGKEDA